MMQYYHSQDYTQCAELIIYWLNRLLLTQAFNDILVEIRCDEVVLRMNISSHRQTRKLN